MMSEKAKQAAMFTALLMGAEDEDTRIEIAQNIVTEHPDMAATILSGLACLLSAINDDDKPACHRRRS